MATFTFTLHGADVGTFTASGSANAYRQLLSERPGRFDRRIDSLRQEAVYAGDWRQVALCDRAQGRDVGAGHPGSIDMDSVHYAESFTVDQAADICAGVLLDAWVMVDGYTITSDIGVVCS
jgi:hypothetical protein